MIDLHVHFDGSLPVETMIKLANKQHISLPAVTPEDLRPYVSVPQTCKDLNEYLKKFDLPLSLLQTKEGIAEAMYDTIKAFAKQGLWYVEIRFAPQLHCEKGLSQDEVVQAAMEGMQAGVKETDLKVQLILCCMRGDKNEEENKETVRLASKYLGQGICACDLAGAEALFKTERFASVFALARELNVPFTIHAGEADGAESVRTAIAFGASRIGHGVRAAEDKELLKLIKEKGIVVECCPVSNLQTKAVTDIKEHPIISYLHDGILATVNTDNTTVSSTNIAGEWKLLEETFTLTVEDKKQLLLNAIEGAFLGEAEKQKLRDTLKD